MHGLFIQGGLFILVVTVLPQGIMVGLTRGAKIIIDRYKLKTR